MHTGRQLSVAVVGFLVACSTVAACGNLGGSVPDSAEPLVLRTYEVPRDRQDDIREMLQSALGAGESGIGRVTNGPRGTVLVVAPARIQADIVQLLGGGLEAPPASGPITLTYWFVVGRPLDRAPDGRPYALAGTTDDSRLDPVLREIAAVEGPTEFSLLEQIQLTSMNRDDGMVTGRFGRVRQRATTSGAGIVADVAIYFGLNGPSGSNILESQLLLEPGQFVVMGQSGLDYDEPMSASTVGISPQGLFSNDRTEDLHTLYYVISAALQP